MSRLSLVSGTFKLLSKIKRFYNVYKIYSGRGTRGAACMYVKSIKTRIE